MNADVDDARYLSWSYRARKDVEWFRAQADYCEGKGEHELARRFRERADQLAKRLGDNTGEQA